NDSDIVEDLFLIQPIDLIMKDVYELPRMIKEKKQSLQKAKNREKTKTLLIQHNEDVADGRRDEEKIRVQLEENVITEGPEPMEIDTKFSSSLIPNSDVTVLEGHTSKNEDVADGGSDEEKIRVQLEENVITEGPEPMEIDTKFSSSIIPNSDVTVLEGSRTESGFKRACATLSGQDIETFTGTMFLNMEQLEKQLEKEDFQEIGSMVAFNVLETQFQMFITSRVYLNDEYVAMTRSYFIQYTQQAIPEFRDILIQHLESVKKLIDERAQHKKEYDSWVNEKQMQTTEEKVDTSKALDARSVDTESSRMELKEQDTSSRSGNDAHDDGADIRPIYNEEPMAKVQTTAEINVFAIGQQHTEQPEFNNEGEIVQNAEECHDTYPLPAILTDNQIPEHSYQSLESKNICLQKTVAQFQ
nr:G-protein beta WD-40 repeat-containing protein [Tanacetum cinerariifolium]